MLCNDLSGDAPANHRDGYPGSIRGEDHAGRVTDERWEELIELLDAAESLDYVKQLIENHIERAMEALGTLPRTEARDMMFELVKISESRRN